MRLTAVSTDEMTMTTKPVCRLTRTVSRGGTALWYFQFFRQCFREHISGYDIFYSIRQIVELSREPRYTVFIATEVIRQ